MHDECFGKDLIWGLDPLSWPLSVTSSSWQITPGDTNPSLLILRTSSIFVLKVRKLLFHIDSLSTFLLLLSQPWWCAHVESFTGMGTFTYLKIAAEMKFNGDVGEVLCWGLRKKLYKNKNGTARSSPHASVTMHTDKETEAENRDLGQSWPWQSLKGKAWLLQQIPLTSHLSTMPHTSLSRAFRISMLVPSVAFFPTPALPSGWTIYLPFLLVFLAYLI